MNSTLRLIIGLTILATAVPSLAQGPRQRVLLDANWRFHAGDILGSGMSKVTSWKWKAASNYDAAEGALSKPPVSDDTWQDTKPGDDTFHGRRGYTWYETVVPAGDSPNTVRFSSVDDNGVVFLNGKFLINHRGWNDAFQVDLTKYWNPTGPNVLAVLVENTAGAGGIGETVFERVSDTATTGPAAARFDDRSWRTLDVPHDFGIELEYDKSADAGHGFLKPGVGWYRRTINVPVADRGRKLFLDFDGVYRNSSVWLNGRLLGKHASGYTPFRFDISNAVTYGAANTIVVRVDASTFEGWWYEGGGIYRHVWLEKTAPVHVAQFGTFVRAEPHLVSAGNADYADIKLQTTLANDSDGLSFSVVKSIIYNPLGQKMAAAAISDLGTKSNSEKTLEQRLQVTAPLLWSIERPNLYTLVTLVYSSTGKLLDKVTTPFGIRTFEFDAKTGFWLNGRSVKLKGTCNHTDFAGVGIALPDRLHNYKIEKLLEMGSNAFRCSHNPPANELLDSCDRLGMVVMDENRHLGGTYSDHSPAGTQVGELKDLETLILRDRNHPSIIIWSMCNEENLQGTPEGGRIFKAMMDRVKELDPTRPVSAAMNYGWGSGISQFQDLQGINYHPNEYDNYHRRFPNKPVYGSETASAVSTRGIYQNDPTKGYVSAYDLNAPDWAQTSEVAWTAIADRPFVAGGFVWTGFDYRGEPTPYQWPCINSHFGILDTCGFPKDNYFYYKVWWGNKPVVHLLPHWNWPGREGQEMDVWCHSNCERVELFLNGVSLGSKPMKRNSHLEWKVKYAPGKLEARGYNGSQLTARHVVQTPGRAASIALKPNTNTILADGEDVVAVEVTIRDAKGFGVATADNLVRFKVTGGARILGVGNGDPSSHEPDTARQRHAFNGKCLVLIQSTAKAGPVTLTAESDGLVSGVVTLVGSPGAVRKGR